MKNFIKYVSIAMIVIGAYVLITKTFLLYRFRVFNSSPRITFQFLNSVAMLVFGIMSVKFYEDRYKYKMLMGISWAQTLFCLLTVFICNSLWISLKLIGIGDILSIACSVIILIYYISAWKKQKAAEKQ